MNRKPRSIASFFWRYLNGQLSAHYTFWDYDDCDKLNVLLGFLRDGKTILDNEGVYPKSEIDKTYRLFREIIITKDIKVNPKVLMILNGVNKIYHKEFMEFMKQQNPQRIRMTHEGM